MNVSEVSAAAILSAARKGKPDLAKDLLARMIKEEFGFTLTDITLGADDYSLNSVNGFMTRDDGEHFFFKFHHEENEESVLQEFYRGEILVEAGFPVDMPIHICRRVGRQILLYPLKTVPKLADAARAAEHQSPLPGADEQTLITAQTALDKLSAEIYLRTWHPITEADSLNEPIHQLFYHRLTTPGTPPDSLGGRAAVFFAADRLFHFPDTTVTGAQLRTLHWVINGIRYRQTLEDCFQNALKYLSPKALAQSGGVIAHGDAHNANVWFNPSQPEAEERRHASLSFFDPAFAGKNVPALLAEIKATFHNIFAHPNWLYHPSELTETPEIRIDGGVAHITTGWSLTPLRRAFLLSKARELWRPLLHTLAMQNALPARWRETIRSGLFCCPTLVMDLCAASATNPSSRHTPVSSLTGLSIAMMCGTEPEQPDVVSHFLNAIDPTNPRPEWDKIQSP
jgi:hypothetical protein|nr:hypothetical protein [Acetobacter syzygii]